MGSNAKGELAQTDEKVVPIRLCGSLMRRTEEEDAAIFKPDAAELGRLSIESHHGFTAYQATLKPS